MWHTNSLPLYFIAVFSIILFQISSVMGTPPSDASNVEYRDAPLLAPRRTTSMPPPPGLNSPPRTFIIPVVSIDDFLDYAFPGVDENSPETGKLVRFFEMYDEQQLYEERNDVQMFKDAGIWNEHDVLRILDAGTPPNFHLVSYQAMKNKKFLALLLRLNIGGFIYEYNDEQLNGVTGYYVEHPHSGEAKVEITMCKVLGTNGQERRKQFIEKLKQHHALPADFNITPVQKAVPTSTRSRRRRGL